MLVKAQQKYIRVSPRKVRLVVDGIRGLTPQQALQELAFLRKRAAVVVGKTIKQAIANARHNANLSEESLRFAAIEVGEGPRFKRWRAVSRGRAHQILKRTSHLTVLLRAQETVPATSQPRGQAPIVKSGKVSPAPRIKRRPPLTRAGDERRAPALLPKRAGHRQPGKMEMRGKQAKNKSG